MAKGVDGLLKQYGPDRHRAAALFLISLLALFYELAFIRWLPANILSLAYFSNVVLISCFLGIGIGCLVSRKKNLFAHFPVFLLVAVVIYLVFRQFEVVVSGHGGEWIWSHYEKNKLNPSGFKIGILPTLSIVFVVNSALFVPVGQHLARLMSGFPSIKAYSINIGGSLAGVVLFGFLSFVGGYLNSPELWFGLGALILVWFSLESKKCLLETITASVVLIWLLASNSTGEIWSPYYSIQLREKNDGSVLVYVNRFFHQEATNFEKNPDAVEKFDLAFSFKKPGNLLILGAGTGNDVAMAKAHGIKNIDAVEIDPVIVELGKQLHPSRPYQGQPVRMVVDDARSFLRKSEKKYDMVLFGTLDSHALLSGMSTVRLDNYVYTLECLQDVKRVLAPDGVVVIIFSVQVDWIAEKLIHMVGAVFPDPAPVVYLGERHRYFSFMIAAGPGLKEWLQAGGKDARIFGQVTVPPDAGKAPSDDWPYLYLQGRTIPISYLKAIAILSVVSILAVWLASSGQTQGKPGMDWNMFVLGAAFLLLETKSVTTMSLLFGSTWLVNVFVFAAILFMILLANALMIKKGGIINVQWTYGLLGLSLLINFLIPISSFLGGHFWIRSASAALLVGAPLFFAALIFAYHFKSVQQPGLALGANLIGAVLGGFFEYSSMMTGLNMLYVVAALFYLASYLLTMPRKGLLKRAADFP